MALMVCTPAFPRRVITPATLAGALCVSYAPSAWSQDDPITLQTIEVHSALVATDLQNLPASASVLDARQMQDRQLQVNLSEAMVDIPGLTLNNRNNYAQDLQLAIRGYGARSTFGVRGVRIYVDGIPATMPDGQGQTSNIDIGSLSHVEVLRGPYSALYGNASGGVVSFFTEDPQGSPTVSAGFAAGSYGQRRWSAKASGQTDAGIGYVLSGSRFLTDGYRDHSGANRTLSNAKLVVPMADDSRLTVVANTLRSFARDPQGLTWAQWRDDPRQASAVAAQYNTRKSLNQQQLGVTYDRKLNADHHLSLTAYHGHRSMLQYQSIPPSVQAAPGHAGGVIDMARDYTGVDLRWTGRVDAPIPVQITAGLDVQHVAEDRQGYENFIGDRLGVKGALRRDESNRVTSTDPYAQATWELTERLSLDTGLRYSRVRFRTHDRYVRAGNPDDSGSATYGKALPFASLSYRITPGHTVYGSVGRGFETPTITEMSYRADGGPRINAQLRPSTSTQFELGYKHRFNKARLRGHWSAAVFQANTRDEIVSAGSNGGRTTYRNAGQTRRRGFELEGQLHVTEDWIVRAAYTWLDARFRQDAGDGAAGNRLPGIAQHQAYLGLDWRMTSAWTAGIGVQARGKVYANDANTAAAPGYATTALSLGYRRQLNTHWQLDAFARIDNVFDKNYIGSVIVNDGNQRYFESAMGRNWAAGVVLSYRIEGF